MVSIIPAIPAKAEPADVVFAKIVVLSAQLYSDSYDHSAADAAEAEDNQKRLNTPEGELHYSTVDYAKFYRRSILESAEIAAAEYDVPELGFPVYLSLAYTWNDVLEWADTVINPEKAAAKLAALEASVNALDKAQLPTVAEKIPTDPE